MAQRHHTQGFTLVELLVIIAVLAVLAGMTYIFIGDWRTRTATTEVKSDLISASSALENRRNFSSGYPSSLTSPAVFTPTGTVTLAYTLRGDGSYCLNGSSKAVGSVQWYIDSRSGKTPLEGACTP